ncbi:hypothetical protein [Acinetobacter baumannii]|uniref:hypothetical protein n=1 Tax=Acinetobacter baumannii TaxID=470 RepID=UPI00244BD0BC|nr:hypothetical protein [Acinetobacter baumannii]MDH2644737.1 hypothetical protein [Acinetobacter baumannii]
MKPEHFIREFGVDKARDLLDQLHKLGCPDDMKITVINGMWQRTSNGFTYPELKRLVESVDLVESWGGIEDLKLYDLSHCKDKPESAGYKLLKAIADYESIYGGSHE